MALAGRCWQAADGPNKNEALVNRLMIRGSSSRARHPRRPRAPRMPRFAGSIWRPCLAVRAPVILPLPRLALPHRRDGLARLCTRPCTRFQAGVRGVGEGTGAAQVGVPAGKPARAQGRGGGCGGVRIRGGGPSASRPPAARTQRGRRSLKAAQSEVIRAIWCSGSTLYHIPR